MPSSRSATPSDSSSSVLWMQFLTSDLTAKSNRVAKRPEIPPMCYFISNSVSSSIRFGPETRKEMALKFQEKSSSCCGLVSSRGRRLDSRLACKPTSVCVVFPLEMDGSACRVCGLPSGSTALHALWEQPSFSRTWKADFGIQGILEAPSAHKDFLDALSILGGFQGSFQDLEFCLQCPWCEVLHSSAFASGPHRA